MNAGFLQEAYQKATRVRLGRFTFSSFNRGRAWRMACYSCPCTAWNVSAGCLPAVFAQLFHTKKKAKNICRAIFAMLPWLAAVHYVVAPLISSISSRQVSTKLAGNIDFAAVSSTVMPLFRNRFMTTDIFSPTSMT